MASEVGVRSKRGLAEENAAKANNNSKAGGENVNKSQEVQRTVGAVALLLLAWSGLTAAQPEGLTDPITTSIVQGEVVVGVQDFLQLPKTVDPHDRPTRQEGIPIDLVASGAHARIQQMMPLPDGSGRLAVTDLRGVLYLSDAEGKELHTYIDLRELPDFAPDVFPNEAGLLGFAFHPQFGAKGTPGFGKLYLGYSVKADSGEATYLGDRAFSHHSVIVEYTARRPKSNSVSGARRELLRIGQFAQSHNVGTMSFNPYALQRDADYGLLYICMGDGGSAYDPENNGQNLATPLGTILRIDPLASGADAYTVPADNPFVGREGALPEIWAYGLRHPQHFSFDTDGTLYINDIGQNHVEEVNVGVAGGNYGWRVREGTFATGFDAGVPFAGTVFDKPAVPGFIGPVAEYDHNEGYAIGGGYVYRGTAIPALYGKYIAGDIVTGRLFYFDTHNLTPGKPATLKELRVSVDGEETSVLKAFGHPNTYNPGTLRADLRMGMDSSGELYLLTKGDGRVRRMVAVGS